MAKATEEPDFNFHLLLINLTLKLNSHMWLVATILESRALDLIIRHRSYKGLDLTGMAQWIEP